MFAGLGVHDLVERSLHARLQTPRQLVEDVAKLVEPIPLLAALRPHVSYRRPEAKGTITHGNSGRAHAPALQVAEHGLPTLRALPVAVLHRDHPLRPLRPPPPHPHP